MVELNPTVREQEIYEEMELTPEMVKSIRTLCATCLRHFVEAKAFKIALVPSPDKSMDEFLNITGVGEKKAARYGMAFLRAIEDMVGSRE